MTKRNDGNFVGEFEIRKEYDEDEYYDLLQTYK